jgi:hypothetical protein
MKPAALSNIRHSCERLTKNATKLACAGALHTTQQTEGVALIVAV